MKKILCMLAVLVMLFSLAACAAQSAPEGSAAAEADGQNPIMNYVGVYGQGRATMVVEPDGTDGAKITVTWGSSAWEHSEWVMTGKFDEETKTISYSDAVRTDLVYKEDGTVDSETVAYENGTGTITFQDGETLTLTWDDAVEHIADEAVFEYASMG